MKISFRTKIVALVALMFAIVIAACAAPQAPANPPAAPQAPSNPPAAPNAIPTVNTTQIKKGGAP